MSNRCSIRPDDPSRPESAIVDRPQRANRTVQVVGQPPPTSGEPMNKANTTGNGTSRLSTLNRWVKVLELDPGILGRKAPVDATARSVAGRLPGHDLPLQRRLVGQPA